MRCRVLLLTTATAALAAGLLISSVARAAEQVEPKDIEIEWFNKAREGSYAQTSFMQASALALGDKPRDHKCTVAMLNEPKAPYCPWCQQQLRPCKHYSEAVPTSFQVNENASNNADNRDGGATIQANAKQNAVFTPKSLHVTNKIATKYDGRGSVTGVAKSSGDVYFRVPGPIGAYMRFKGTMNWSPQPLSNRGGVQFRAIPNTGADLSAGFSSGWITTTAVPPVQLVDEDRYKKKDEPRRLSPGVYVMQWGAGGDSVAWDSGVTVDFELDFEKVCQSDTRDTDKDGLPDEWETTGIVITSGECVPYKLVFPPGDLPDPKVKDVYIELDQMLGFDVSGQALKLVRDAFLDNDATRGAKPSIKLHFLLDEWLPASICTEMRHGNRTAVEDCKGSMVDGRELADARFGTQAQRQRTDWPQPLKWEDIKEARRRVFHHFLAVNLLLDDPKDDPKVKGLPYSAPDGRQRSEQSPDFFVAVGRLRERMAGTLRPKGIPVPPDRTSTTCKKPKPPFSMHRYAAVTFMHEFGHTLGLKHDGCMVKGDRECIPGKPNYISIMQYTYGALASTDGIQCTAGLVKADIDYSREALAPLNECELREADGVGAGRATLKNSWVIFAHTDAAAAKPETYEFAPAKGAINWDLDGNLTETLRGINIHDFVPTQACQTLMGFNDWKMVEVALACRLYFPDQKDCP